MKSVLTGLAVMVVISVGAFVALNAMGFSTQEANSGANVRID